MDRPDASVPSPAARLTRRRNWIRFFVLGLVLGAVVSGYWHFGDFLTLDQLARQEADLRQLQQQSPLFVFGGALLIYVAVTGLSLPGATPLSLLYGWYFGWLWGVLLVSFASTSGASVAFLLSRFLFREGVERRFGKQLRKFRSALEREGPFYLFLLRLVPAVPFFLINMGMGLSPIRLWTFWWVSQLGMLPGTIIYVYAGSSVPSLEQLAEQGIQAVFSPSQLAQILLALALLGLFPLLVRRLVARFRTESHAAGPQHGDSHESNSQHGDT